MTIQRFTLLVFPCCILVAACGTPQRPLPDISHARVWHAENGFARATTGEVPVYSPYSAPQQYQAAATTSPNVKTTVNTPIAPVVASVTTSPSFTTLSSPPPTLVSPVYTNNTSSIQTSAPVIDLGDTTPISTFSRYKNDDFLPLIMQAENQSSGYVKSILAKSREMTLYNKEIIEGGCWDYLDAAWTRAGVGRNMRQTIYKSSYGGTYAHEDDLRTGDWIYHINHSYKNIEHSGMFIGWVDKSQNLGLTLSYAGEGRKEPARYKVYDLSSVYNIMRAP